MQKFIPVVKGVRDRPKGCGGDAEQLGPAARDGVDVDGGEGVVEGVPSLILLEPSHLGAGQERQQRTWKPLRSNRTKYRGLETPDSESP